MNEEILFHPLHPSWLERKKKIVADPRRAELMDTVQQAYTTTTVYPAFDQIFSVLSLGLDDIRVVILGQDPYHKQGQAHGISFSVAEGVKIPPSLRMMFKEIVQSGEVLHHPDSGNLLHWHRQGVFLLNTCLTVEESKPKSHDKYGRGRVTTSIIETITQSSSPIVFCLWGSDAKAYKSLIPDHHIILESVHPSPLSAYRGFIGCNHFATINEWLDLQGQATIKW